MYQDRELDAILRYTGAGQDLHGHIANCCRCPFLRKGSAKQTDKPRLARSAAIPLTSAEKVLLDDLMPIAQRAARKVARQWGADTGELEKEGVILSADAIRRFDGRGDLRSFVGQKVKHGLIDKLKHERGAKHGDCWRRPGTPLYHLREVWRRKTCRDVVLAQREQDEESQAGQYAGDEFAAWDDPRRPSLVAEAADAIRRHLSQRDIEILRLRVSEMKPKGIARLLRIKPWRVYAALDGIRRRVRRVATEFELPAWEIGVALLHNDQLVKARAMKVLGYSAEDISKFAESESIHKVSGQICRLPRSRLTHPVSSSSS